jgi:hypothetical protein
MRKPVRIASHIGVIALMFLAVFRPADARTHRYWRTHPAVSDNDYGNVVLSPCSYIYPEADWRPFFHRERHFGPLLHLRPHSPCWVFYGNG